VMRLVRGNGRADQQALDLRQERFVSHRDLQRPTGLADGLEVGVLYHRLRPAGVGVRIRPGAAHWPRGSPVSLYAERLRHLDYRAQHSVRTRPAPVLMTFLRLSAGRTLGVAMRSLADAPLDLESPPFR
jgi:hypothetical protein